MCNKIFIIRIRRIWDGSVLLVFRMEATESNGFSEISSDTVEQESNNDANEEKQEECQGEQKHENPITEPLSPVIVTIVLSV